AVLAAGEADRAGTAGFEPVEQLLVALPGIRQLAGGGNDGDVGVASAAQLHEALEDATPHLLVLCPADRDHPATFFALGDLAWTHCVAGSFCRVGAACCVVDGPCPASSPQRGGGQNTIIHDGGRRPAPPLRPEARNARTSARDRARAWRRG